MTDFRAPRNGRDDRRAAVNYRAAGAGRAREDAVDPGNRQGKVMYDIDNAGPADVAVLAIAILAAVLGLVFMI